MSHRLQTLVRRALENVQSQHPVVAEHAMNAFDYAKKVVLTATQRIPVLRKRTPTSH